jgi:hypothetical protein
MNKLEELSKSRPDFARPHNMWFVGSYEIFQGSSIEPVDPGKPTEEDVWEVDYSDDVRHYFPLQDPSLFSSFIRMGARGMPSEKKILSWVNQYGLLRLDQTGTLPLPLPYEKAVVDGMLNQAPMSVEDFRGEVMQARSAMLLCQDLRRSDEGKLLERLIAMRENPSSQLSALDRMLVNASAGPKNRRSLLLPVARIHLETLVERKLSSVRLSFWNMAEATDMDDEWTEQSDEYVLAQSWRCPDLLSMIYMQFYLVMVNAVPLGICEHPRCRTPFPANRKDKRFCTDTCRSGARRYA